MLPLFNDASFDPNELLGVGVSLSDTIVSECFNAIPILDVLFDEPACVDELGQVPMEVSLCDCQLPENVFETEPCLFELAPVAAAAITAECFEEQLASDIQLELPLVFSCSTSESLGHFEPPPPVCSDSDLPSLLSDAATIQLNLELVYAVFGSASAYPPHFAVPAVANSYPAPLPIAWAPLTFELEDFCCPPLKLVFDTSALSVASQDEVFSELENPHHNAIEAAEVEIAPAAEPILRVQPVAMSAASGLSDFMALQGAKATNTSSRAKSRQQHSRPPLRGYQAQIAEQMIHENLLILMPPSIPMIDAMAAFADHFSRNAQVLVVSAEETLQQLRALHISENVQLVEIGEPIDAHVSKAQVVIVDGPLSAQQWLTSRGFQHVCFILREALPRLDVVQALCSSCNMQSIVCRTTEDLDVLAVAGGRHIFLANSGHLQRLMLLCTSVSEICVEFLQRHGVLGVGYQPQSARQLLKFRERCQDNESRSHLLMLITLSDTSYWLCEAGIRVSAQFLHAALQRLASNIPSDLSSVVSGLLQEIEVCAEEVGLEVIDDSPKFATLLEIVQQHTPSNQVIVVVDAQVLIPIVTTFLRVSKHPVSCMLVSAFLANHQSENCIIVVFQVGDSADQLRTLRQRQFWLHVESGACSNVGMNEFVSRLRTASETLRYDAAIPAASLKLGMEATVTTFATGSLVISMNLLEHQQSIVEALSIAGFNLVVRGMDADVLLSANSCALCLRSAELLSSSWMERVNCIRGFQLVFVFILASPDMPAAEFAAIRQAQVVSVAFERQVRVLVLPDMADLMYQLQQASEDAHLSAVETAHETFVAKLSNPLAAQNALQTGTIRELLSAVPVAISATENVAEARSVSPEPFASTDGFKPDPRLLTYRRVGGTSQTQLIWRERE
eukprot:TRINITY_DN12424_c0_g1_i1.p1 TRINITY_DN12424_c0_g1~~TRINITY_DN12424_c0_g1_i1.p1  ORF type:complete len:903 (-),score=160.89 TRINITY_DN12424_c0_g1_i1:17-2725(-)